MGYSCAVTKEENVSHSCKDVPYSLSGKWSANSKILLIAVMLVGRHRGLPDNIDSAIILPHNLTTTILDNTSIYNHKKLNLVHNPPAVKDSQSFHNACTEELSVRVYSNWACTHMDRSMETRLSNVTIKSENVVITAFNIQKQAMQKNAIESQFIQEKGTSTAPLENPINWCFIAFTLDYSPASLMHKEWEHSDGQILSTLMISEHKISELELSSKFELHSWVIRLQKSKQEFESDWEQKVLIP